MATVKININTDAETKEQAQQLFKSLGFDMTTAVNAFLKRSILENGLPFPVNANLPNDATIAAMEEFNKMKKNPSSYKKYANFNEALSEVLDNA